MTRTAFVFLFMVASARAGSLGLQISGQGAFYEGPDAPTTDTFDYDATISFDPARLVLDTTSPSGSGAFDLDPSVMNEGDQAFFSTDDLQLTIVSALIDLTTEEIDDSNIDQVDRIKIAWWDPQIDDGFLTTALKIEPDERPKVIAIPEPSAALLMLVGLLAIAVRVSRDRSVPFLPPR